MITLKKLFGNVHCICRNSRNFLILFSAVLALSGCSKGDEAGESAKASGSEKAAVTTTEGIDVNLTGEYSDNALDYSYDEASASVINLNGDEVSVAGSGAKVSGSKVTITQKGTYIVRGSLNDGQILVELTEDKNVHLVLDNVNISCSYGSAIQVISVKNLYLTLADGSVNEMSDGSEYAEDTSGDNPNAAIFSQEDLIINGTGKLNVTGNYRDGITSKDDLTIVSGDIKVDAVDDAIVGKDSVTIKEPVLNLSCDGDGIKSSNTKDLKKGVVIIDGGEITINAGDDGIHSETVIVINNGTLNVENSLEGIESLNVVINDGDISVISSDDGINISGGTDTNSSDVPMRGMGGGMDKEIDGALVINGGNISVNAQGDGLDSNGGILITGGNVVVAGPASDGDGAFDYNGDMEIDGGTIFAYGSSGMAQISSESSSQTFVAASVDSYSEQDSVSICDENGDEIALYTVEKQGTFIFYSSDKLVKDSSYTIIIEDNKTEVKAGDNSLVSSVMGRNHGGMKGGMGKGERSDGERPSGEMPDGEKPSGEMPDGEKPDGERPDGREMPDGERPSGEKPSGGMSDDIDTSDKEI